MRGAASENTGVGGSLDGLGDCGRGLRWMLAFELESVREKLMGAEKESAYFKGKLEGKLKETA